MAVDQYGRIIRRGPRPEIPVYEAPTYSTTSYSYSPSFGQRMRNVWYGFSNFIIGIGNWFARNLENISTGATAIVGIGGIIALLIWVITIFANEGIFFGILAIIGAIIIGYIGTIGLGIGIFLLSLALQIIRFIFWNGWTFLLAIAVTLTIVINNNNTPTTPTEISPVETVTSSDMGTYRCTASVLNVRQTPSKTGKVIGTLTRNQRATVIRTEGNFAVIEFNGQKGYVSLDYMRKE